MDRATLQAIAQAKLDDAELLFQHGRFANAYYLFGYAAEIALKASVSRRFQPNTIPDRRFVNDVYTHDLERLIGLAELGAEFEKRRKASPQFESHWSAVSDWEEASRYAKIDELQSTAMRNAMMDDEHGVFAWLRLFW